MLQPAKVEIIENVTLKHVLILNGASGGFSPHNGSSAVRHLLCESHRLPRGTDDSCVCISQADQHLVDL